METEAGRTTDPVRMYMREMGTVELLTREGEIVIAKRIEEGIREMLAALALYPGAVKKILDEYDLVAKEERRLADIMVGYLDPADHVPSAAEVAEAAAAPAADDDDDESRHRPGPGRGEEALYRAQAPVQQNRESHCREGPPGQGLHQGNGKTGRTVQVLQVHPRVSDPLTDTPRNLLMAVRDQEREIMRLAVKVCGMPRKDFIAPSRVPRLTPSG